MPGRIENMFVTNCITGSGSAGCTSGSGRRIPFGRPVVPDEYSIAAPSCSSSTGVVGCSAMAASYGRNGPMSRSASMQRNTSTLGVFATAASATSTLATDVMNTPASQLSTM